MVDIVASCSCLNFRTSLDFNYVKPRFRFVTTLISKINFMTIDFDYLIYLTSTKLKKVDGKNVKPVSHLILKVRTQ